MLSIKLSEFINGNLGVWISPLEKDHSLVKWFCDPFVKCFLVFQVTDLFRSEKPITCNLILVKNWWGFFYRSWNNLLWHAFFDKFFAKLVDVWNRFIEKLANWVQTHISFFTFARVKVLKSEKLYHLQLQWFGIFHFGNKF